MITIRALTSEDEPILREMLYHALFLPPNHKPYPRNIIHRPEIACYVEGWGRPADVGVLALDVDKPIGAAWLRLFSVNQPGFGYVDDFTPELSIAVIPNYRNQGIGTKLLRHLLQRAETHFAAISLSVASDNPARRLYERFGFEIFREDALSFTMIKQMAGGS